MGTKNSPPTKTTIKNMSANTNTQTTAAKKENKNITAFTGINNFVIEFFNEQDVDGEIIDAWNNRKEKFIELIDGLIKVKTTRAKKAKDAPKNAKSAYMFFCADKRAEVKEQNPELGAKEITTKLGALWKEIKDNEEVVEKYNQLAAADKDRYKEDMANYVPSEEVDTEKPEKKKRAKKPKDAPKNAKSAYMFFCADKRAEVKEQNPELTPKEITTKLGAMWKEIKDNEEEVEKYNQLAVTDKDRYKEEMANYVPIEEVETEKPEKKKRAKKAKDAPKNAKSAYMFFCQEMRASVKEENPELSPKDITTKLGAMWKEIKDNEEEVEKYNQLAAADKDRYKEEMTNYVPSEGEAESDNENSDKKGKKEKTTKKPKDAPKNAKSAYIFFCADKRAEVKEENPELSAKEITIKLGEMWKEIKDTEEAKKYNEMASTDKDRYKEEMENYVPSEVDTEKPEKKKSDSKKTDSKKTESKKTESKKTESKKTKKVSNEDLVREIIENCDNESITMKLIKDELKKKGVEIPKEELKEIISKINEDDE